MVDMITQTSAIAMKRQKKQQVLLGNADDAADAMSSEVARGEPSPDSSNRHLQAISRLLQGHEPKLSGGTPGHNLTLIGG